jgi:glutaredoxin-related protein
MNGNLIGVQNEPECRLSPAVVEVLLQWGNHQYLANQTVDDESLMVGVIDEQENIGWNF